MGVRRFGEAPMAFLPVIEHARDCAVSALAARWGWFFSGFPPTAYAAGFILGPLRGDISPLRSAVRNEAGLGRRLARPAVKLRVSLDICSLLLVLGSLSCSKRQSPQQAYDHTYQLFLQGNLDGCRAEAKGGHEIYRESSPGWAAKFANLEAECLLWAGLSQEALTIYSSRNLSFGGPDSRIFALSLEASAHTHLRHFDDAHERLQQAEALCVGTTFLSCGNAKVAAGMLSIQEDHLDTAEKEFSDGLALARRGGDRFTEATAELDLGLVALRQRRFDEASDRIAETLRLSDAVGAREIAQSALGNQAWGYYRLGNFTGALELFREAERRASSHGDFGDQAACLTGIGKVQFERSQFAAAAEAFQQALTLEEEKVHSVEVIYMDQVPLAQLALQRGDLQDAEGHVQKALNIARAARNHVDELYPILIQGQIAARRGDMAEAAQKFSEVERDEQSQVFVKWEAQRLLAGLAEQQNDVVVADREYRSALTTFEGARRDVQLEALQLSFLSNGVHIYDDYIHFLVAHGRANDALRWAEYSRARTLAQGLGVLDITDAKEPRAAGGRYVNARQIDTEKIDTQKIQGRQANTRQIGAPQTSARQISAPQISPEQISLKSGGTLLFYWLGAKQSYLWAITPKKTALFTLPAAEEIEAAIQRYRGSLEISGSKENAALADRDGIWLYRTLVAPAQSLIAKGGRVFIFADAGLNNLNFETVIVSESVPGSVQDSPPHFWIEDVSVICGSALRVVGRKERSPLAVKVPRTLLLIGNSVSPNDKYPRLERAAEQVKTVSRHFSAERRRIIEQENATPGAYLAATPERYSVIHFVAHGTASRTSPLDSAIVLSRPGVGPSAGNDLFKLYARDIVRHPVGADLVVISACYSAGDSAFAGEGLVGLSWAFQRAGARNVVAALGEVSAASAIPLMEQFYGELDQGAMPDVALRDAKLSLLRDERFRSPFYWAPFQLYGTGRMRAGR